MKRKRQGEEFLGDGVRWCRGSLIGNGSFGSVYLAHLYKSRPQYGYLPSVFAVKSAEISDSCSIQKEKEALNNIGSSPSIIRCLGEEITKSESGMMVFNLLLEYASGGTLAQLINNSNGLPESDVRQYTRSILQGIKCIHEHGYVHCDIKPHNILLVTTSSGGKYKAKIADLGLAKRVRKQYKMRKLDHYNYLRGTRMYLSPETVVDHVQEPPSDIWSLGCVVFEMLTGKTPWPNLDANALVRHISGARRLPKIPSEISKEGKDFLNLCFVRKAKKRWSAEMLLKHPFVEGLVDEDGVVEGGEEVFDADINLSLPLLVTDDDDDEVSCSSSVVTDDAMDIKRSGIAVDVGGINETSPHEVLSNIVQQSPTISMLPVVVLQH